MSPPPKGFGKLALSQAILYFGCGFVQRIILIVKTVYYHLERAGPWGKTPPWLERFMRSYTILGVLSTGGSFPGSTVMKERPWGSGYGLHSSEARYRSFKSVKGFGLSEKIFFRKKG